jgi:hypothetical protein
MAPVPHLPAGALLPHSLGPYIVLMAAGFGFGIVGHIWRLRWVVIVGIILIFLGTLLLPLALVATNPSPPEPPAPVAPPQ